MREIKRVGLAVVGAGRIGTLRAQLACGHSAVDFIAVADADAARAQELAQKVGAQFHCADNLAAISRPEVSAVIVSTSEGEHVAPVLQALERGKSVLVEKPIALSLADAERIVSAAQARGADLRVGYSRRYKVYNSRSQALAMLKRNPGATPVVDALTYYVDLVNWLLEGAHVTEVFARGQRGVLEAAGHATDDVSWAIVTYSSGAVASFGVSYALPEKYPALGHAARVELLGTEGVMILDDDHTDQLMYSEKGVPHVYLPDHSVNMVFLQSGTPGDWALGELWGPIASETRAWLDHLALGKPCALATAGEARHALEATLAIEQSAASRKPVTLPLGR
jgi:predicted dehydrogenase